MSSSHKLWRNTPSVQSLNRVRLCNLMSIACQASLSVTNSQSLPKFMSIELVMQSSHIILCRPLLLLHSIFPSIRVFSSELVLCIRWPMYWSFSFSISPSNEHSGPISFRMDWLDLLAVQGTLKSLLQHHSSKASVLQCWAFFMVQFAHPYLAQGRLFFPGSSGSKESACHTENLGSVPGSGGSHWGGNRNPPQ